MREEVEEWACQMSVSTQKLVSGFLMRIHHAKMYRQKGAVCSCMVMDGPVGQKSISEGMMAKAFGTPYYVALDREISLKDQ
jgi:hypothetical protein